jgi:type III secretory pathway lipoprotein EscJ
VKRATKGRSMRIKWTQNGSNVDVGFTAKGPGKTSVQVSHGKLASAAEVARQKAFWKDALSRLEAMFEPVSGLH